MAANLQPILDQLARAKTLHDAVIVLIDGFAARLEAARRQAIENGATEAELVPVFEATEAFKVSTDALEEAFFRGTPPGTPEL